MMLLDEMCRSAFEREENIVNVDCDVGNCN